MGHHLVLSTRRDTVRFGRRIASALQRGDLVVLQGPVGVGKTFLARSVARALGVKGAVASPTFSLVNEYATAKGELVHADFYRLRDEGEPLADAVARLGLRDRRAEGAIVVAEWADEASSVLGAEPDLVVVLGTSGAHSRSAFVDGVRAPEVV